VFGGSTERKQAVLQSASGEGMTEEERKLKQQKAMSDPEIQNILTDPIMR
jgi:hypothetical protein